MYLIFACRCDDNRLERTTVRKSGVTDDGIFTRIVVQDVIKKPTRYMGIVPRAWCIRGTSQDGPVGSKQEDRADVVSMQPTVVVNILN